jgi:hypothetical protein
VLAPGWWVLAGLAGLVGSWVWWVRSAGYRLTVQRPTSAPRPRRLGRGQANRPPAGRHVGVTSCGCGGLVVIDAHVAADPAASVARAACGACGARYWGALDPSDPNGGLVWFEVPAAGGGAPR